MPPLIDIRDLDFAYDRSKVLCGVNLAIDAGQTVGLIGPNGGGKTTLLKLLLGLLTPTRGSIRINGLAPKQAVARGDWVGYVPQNPRRQTALPINVRQLVQMGLAGKTGLLRTHSKDDVAFADELIRRVDLPADLPVAQLSGGQLQRAFIARALAPRPKLLLLDEPTTGIDFRGQRGFVDLIQQAKSDFGLTVILVSHDLRAVTSISDRVACLSTHLHYHDTPHHMPAELVYNMFACDLAAMGIGDGKHTCLVHSAEETLAAKSE
ncbi:MAG TPA: metal ABC transporter ATP-binding protein [Tepidisphaeraceae bacterium]|jgi:zinc transport system ATP-binding protein